jgi:uncharacterized protein (DUF433 family)
MLENVKLATRCRMDWSGCNVVEVVPGKVSGAPVVRGSRVLADQVIESHALGEAIEEIAYSFDLKHEDVRDLLAYADAREHTFRR